MPGSAAQAGQGRVSVLLVACAAGVLSGCLAELREFALAVGVSQVRLVYFFWLCRGSDELGKWLVGLVCSRACQMIGRKLQSQHV